MNFFSDYPYDGLFFFLLEFLFCFFISGAALSTRSSSFTVCKSAAVVLAKVSFLSFFSLQIYLTRAAMKIIIKMLNISKEIGAFEDELGFESLLFLGIGSIIPPSSTYSG